jgi:plasmid stability protein
MANLTITVDDSILQKARIRALERGTSVNALLREYLEAYVDTVATRGAIVDFVEIAERSNAGRGKRTWTRDELYER